MEFSELFSFFTIFIESFKLIPKIWKLILPITLISLIFPSLFFWLFSYQYTTFMGTTSNSDFSINSIKYLIILLVILVLVEIAFLAVLFVCSLLSSISTVIVSATAYATGHTIALSDLLDHVQRKWRKPLKSKIRLSRISLIGIILKTFLVSFAVTADLINPITIGLFIVVFILLIIYQFIASAGKVLAYTVSIIEEENSEGSKAVERSEYLTEGQKLKVFMLNMVISIIECVCMLIYWLIFRDQGLMNFTVYGLFFVNFVTLCNVTVLVTNTVLYFQCKKLRGEEIDQVGNQVQYTKLPTAP